MNMTPWQRLHAIVSERIDQLGITRDALHTQGGPSSAWLRALKDREGHATPKQARSLLDLDAVMGWDAGTARGLVNDDRSEWSQEALDAEAYDLAHTNLPDPVVANGAPRLSRAERDVRAMQTIVAAGLRSMDDDQRRKAMADIARILGVSF